MSILPKWVDSFNAIPNQIPAQYLMDTDKVALKFKWKEKRIRTTKKKFLKKKNET